MKKEQLQKSLPWNAPEKFKEYLNHVEEVIAGRRGAPELREKIAVELTRYFAFSPRRHAQPLTTQQNHDSRYRTWKTRKALELAEKLSMNFDEHGYQRGTYHSTRSIDFVPEWAAKAAPYCDMGGEGLALIEVTRTTVYAKSSKWRPSSVDTRFLIGRNEAGTYFAHPVPVHVGGVLETVQWIWGGRANQIIMRQGDIALVAGAGPRIPALPRGHRIEGEYIIHDTHPPLPMPEKGLRIIVGRRAAERSMAATRD